MLMLVVLNGFVNSVNFFYKTECGSYCRCFQCNLGYCQPEMQTEMVFVFMFHNNKNKVFIINDESPGFRVLSDIITTMIQISLFHRLFISSPAIYKLRLMSLN